MYVVTVESKRAEALNSYAVVAYLGDPVAEFVDQVRRVFTPDCPHRAHLTILPPRPLAESLEEALAHCRHALARLEPFEVHLGEVELFAGSQVIKLSVISGEVSLRTLHDALNTGPFDHAEEYAYIPHITLGQDLPPERVAEYLETARERWRQFGAPPVIVVDSLTLVQQAEEGCWRDLVEMNLSESIESEETAAAPVTLSRK